MKMKTIAIASLALLCQTACNLHDSATPSSDNQETADDYMSPDGVLLEVRGNVKKVVVKTTDCDENGNPTIEDWSIKTYVFDKKLRAKLDKAVDDKLTRNDKGQVVKMETVMDNNFHLIQKFTYNDNGLLNTQETTGMDWCGTKTFHYDNQNYLSWTEEQAASEGVSTTEIERYKILEKDSHGNWTKRIVSTTADSEEDEEVAEEETEDDNESTEEVAAEEEDSEDENSYGLEIREITYR